jgi:hypothetical protein
MSDESATVREALQWYADEAAALARHLSGGAHTAGVLASLTVLSLDAGRRARAALAQAEPGQQPVKDHEIAQAVNSLRDIAIQFHATQQLRERIVGVVLPLLKRSRAAEPGQQGPVQAAGAEKLDEQNQCDGCMAGQPINALGNHQDKDGRPTMACQRDRYEHPATSSLQSTPGIADPSS